MELLKTQNYYTLPISHVFCLTRKVYTSVCMRTWLCVPLDTHVTVTCCVFV